MTLFEVTHGLIQLQKKMFLKETAVHSLVTAMLKMIIFNGFSNHGVLIRNRGLG
jgi:hypothetical protein